MSQLVQLVPCQLFNRLKCLVSSNQVIMIEFALPYQLNVVALHFVCVLDELNVEFGHRPPHKWNLSHWLEHALEKFCDPIAVIVNNPSPITAL